MSLQRLEKASEIVGPGEVGEALPELGAAPRRQFEAVSAEELPAAITRLMGGRAELTLPGVVKWTP